MSRAHHGLRARLRRRDPLRLVFVKMPCPAEIELAAATGFDAVIIDIEHGPANQTELEHHLRAAAAAGIPALIRLPAAAGPPILHALDAGAAGIVIAHVTDAATATAAVDAAHYPPRGHRGLALTTRAGRYGTVPLKDHLERAADETVVIVQIEDTEAVPRSPEILAVDGVDGVLIGATDLSISLGHSGAADHPEVIAAIGAIAEAAQRAGVSVAAVVASAADAKAACARGVSAAVFVSTLLIRDALRAAVAPNPAGAAVAPDPAGGTTGVEPLVLLPGMLGTAALWEEVAPALLGAARPQFRRIDLDNSIEEMAESVLATAPERFALAAHSLGAIVALAVVRRAPHRVTRLALLNASARPPSPAQLEGWRALEVRIDAGDFGGLCADFARQNVPVPRRSDAALVTRVEAMAAEVGPRGLLRQLSAQRSRPDGRPHLASIRCPTLIVSGALDEICPAALQEELAATVPHGRLERVECGHMSPLEAPGEVAVLLAEWVA